MDYGWHVRERTQESCFAFWLEQIQECNQLRLRFQEEHILEGKKSQDFVFANINFEILIRCPGGDVKSARQSRAGAWSGQGIYIQELLIEMRLQRESMLTVKGSRSPGTLKYSEVQKRKSNKSGQKSRRTERMEPQKARGLNVQRNRIIEKF